MSSLFWYGVRIKNSEGPYFEMVVDVQQIDKEVNMYAFIFTVSTLSTYVHLNLHVEHEDLWRCPKFGTLAIRPWYWSKKALGSLVRRMWGKFQLLFQDIVFPAWWGRVGSNSCKKG